MIGGAVLAGLAFILASRANSFPPMLIAYLILGVGIGGSTLLPAALVIANWFGARRGLAMGLTFAGTSLGGAAMTIVASRAISYGGWRTGYVTLAIPMLVVVIPIVMLVIRTRPPGEDGQKVSVSEAADALPGLELSEALRTRSFWMIALAQFTFACAASGMGLHLITYLRGLGYAEAFAAGMMSLAYLFTSMGKFGMGFFADRVSARRALAINFVIAAFAMILIFGAGHAWILFPFVFIFGLTLGAPLVLVPLLTAESLGLKRFGLIGGIAGMFNTLGAAIGPVGAGKIFDATGSYATAFQIFLVLLLIGCASALLCRTLEVEQSALEREPAVATA
ncbi:MAG TPA: MFS transporter, partial [Candidatus Binataceae bacterium]|nr:MFS transporter [Candidatus Binataceae bacterium]